METPLPKFHDNGNVQPLLIRRRRRFCGMGHDQLVLLVVFLVVIEMLLAGKSDLGSDRAALLELRKEVSGRTLLWNVSQQSPCGWAEVLCEKNRVVGLRLPGCSLTGEILVGIIGNLTELRVLSLRNAL